MHVYDKHFLWRYMQMKRIQPTLLLFFLMILPFNTIADNNSNHLHIKWLSSTTSVHLNRSTMALASGHPRRGAFYALTAFSEELTETDRLIANHNLCIAYLNLSSERRASRYCMLARDMADPHLYIKTIRGAHYIVEISSDTEGMPSLRTIIVGNIYSNSESPKFAWLKPMK